MTFLNPKKDYQKQNPLEAGLLVGTVVDNEDSKGQNRIRVRIKEVFGTQIPDEKLPWAVPAKPSFLGGAPNVGFHAIPQVGSEVMVTFHRADPYSPMYLFSPHNPNTQISVLQGPDVWGFQDTKGNYLVVNLETGVIEFVTSFGQKFIFDDTGIKLHAETIDLGETGLEPIVLGDALATFMLSLKLYMETHSHLGNLGLPTSPPITIIDWTAVLSGGDAYSEKNKSQ